MFCWEHSNSIFVILHLNGWSKLLLSSWSMLSLQTDKSTPSITGFFEVEVNGVVVHSKKVRKLVECIPLSHFNVNTFCKWIVFFSSHKHSVMLWLVIFACDQSLRGAWHAVMELFFILFYFWENDLTLHLVWLSWTYFYFVCVGCNWITSLSRGISDKDNNKNKFISVACTKEMDRASYFGHIAFTVCIPCDFIDFFFFFFFPGGFLSVQALQQTLYNLIHIIKSKGNWFHFHVK